MKGNHSYGASRNRPLFALHFFWLVALSICPVASRAAHLSAGGLFSCARSEEAKVYCWGKNDVGQLGNGTTTDSDRPVLVAALDDVRDIAAGVRHACALTNAGGVKCWGDNGVGELGDGALIGRNKPVDVAGLQSGVIAIALGFDYSCALLDTGNVRCWGDNYFLELGNDEPNLLFSPVPVDVKLAPGVKAVAVAATGGTMSDPHSCLVTTTGGVQCWGGINAYGETGIPPFQVTTVPHDVTNLANGVVSVAVAGSHSCALTQAGQILCWGDNMFGELGDGTSSGGHFQPKPTLTINGHPIAIAAGGGVVAPGGSYSCATTDSGSTYCWGFNGLGTQATGDRNDSLVPRLTLIAEASDLALSDDHACARGKQGLTCWGSNPNGAVGNGTIAFRNSPQLVQGMNDISSKVFTGGQQSCAILGDGEVQCWGSNQNGQLGDGTYVDRLFPVTVKNLPSDISTMSLGNGHACAVSNSDSVLCWGRGGALGNGGTDDSNTPVSVVGLGPSIAVAAGNRHTCAVLATGTVDCWGGNTQGELGDGKASGEYSLVPVEAVGLASGAIDIASGESHSCALLDSGDVKCWGYNGSGQLGDGTFNESDQPTAVDMNALGQGTVALAAGAQFSCALKSDGSVKCWGLGYDPSPTPINGLKSPAVSITAGDNHACARFADGQIQCWGTNGVGQLGNGTLISSEQPVDVVGISGAIGVDAGASHTCAAAASGDVYCWGSAASGELGNGDYGLWLSPQPVLWDVLWDDHLFSDDFDLATP